MSLKVDGKFGLATEAAVRALQERSGGLVVDGRVGDRTRAVLNL
jgi:peptidoglycan hydrolase-like protein with peptidoglycan-binding domain